MIFFSDSQRYTLTFCLFKDDLDIHSFLAVKCWFSKKVTCAFMLQHKSAVRIQKLKKIDDIFLIVIQIEVLRVTLRYGKATLKTEGPILITSPLPLVHMFGLESSLLRLYFFKLK